MIRLDAPAEVTDFDDIAVLNENIFGLDISMNKSLLVQIIDSGTNLYEEIKRRILAQKLLFTDEVKQIAFRSIFERQIYGGFVLKARVEPTNVLMIQLFLNPNFSYQRFFDLTGRQGCLLDLLDSNLDRILFVAGQLYFTI